MKGARALLTHVREFPGCCSSEDGNVNPRISLGAFWPAIYGNLTRPYCSSGRPRPPDILGVSSSIHRPILMIAVYQVSSFRAVRRTLLRYFATLRGFSASFSRSIPRPIRLLSYKFRLNESPRRFHRFPPMTRSVSDARKTQTLPLIRSKARWRICRLYLRQFVPIIRQLSGKCFINLHRVVSRSSTK